MLPGAFIDRAKVDVYELLGCVSICLTLPFTHQPHRLDSILLVGQYIGEENPNQLHLHIDRWDS